MGAQPAQVNAKRSELTPPLLVFLIDAFRHDFLLDDVTPHLTALAAAGIRRPLQPILGYSDSIRAAFFTGKYPDQTGYWMEYCYRPETSPWTGLSQLQAVDRIPSSLGRRITKMGLSRTLMPMVARSRDVPHLSLRNMPLRAIHKFDLTLRQPITAPQALGCPSIFDFCRAAGRPWLYLDSARAHRSTDLVAQVREAPDNVGLIFVYLHQVDMAAHVFGISSPLFWRFVHSTDALYGRILRAARLRFGDLSPTVFSDHGMSVLLRQRSIDELLNHPGFPDRFLVALDATMVRLWYFDDDASLANELRERVSARFPGHFLNDGELRSFHLRFGSRLYGDDIFLLPPGHGVFPNFHSYIKPKAMHAYDPADRDQWGIFIGPREAAGWVSDPVDLTEITALVKASLAGGL
jgi:hypothetical protein